AECSESQTRLEAAASGAPSANDLSELLSVGPSALKDHIVACGDCRAYAKNILEARSVLAELPSNAALPGPWFAPRVMGLIATRRAELARVPDTWMLLPKLAARLTWASAVALLLASGWLYQRPAVNTAATAARSAMTDITGEPLRDTSMPANNDEVLVSLAERPR
ncbi:MAG: hypothetical protein WA894_12535, partial [Candidatus Acidiferrum sp.]